MLNQLHDPPMGLFLKRLLLRSALTGEEQRAILALTGETFRFAPHTDIVSPGEIVESTCLVTRGLVARYDQMLNGERQITSFYIPGDMCDLHSVVMPKTSWSITAISPATVLRVPHRRLRDLCIHYPAISLAFWRDGTVDASIFAKWVGNLGRKNAKARISHVMCEMGLRMEAASLGTRTSYDLPMTQEQFGEATGLTTVHVNRTLQEIRGAGLLAFRNGRVEINDWESLAETAEFDPSFLMLDEPPHRLAPMSGGHEMASVQ
jgi:CRP-like cAMP-binding protein